MSKTTTVVILLIIILAIISLIFFRGDSDQPVNQDKMEGNPKVLIKTNLGEITVELFLDKAPKTAGNFLKLVEEGFYDGIKFHRVVKDFIVQAGDPLSRGDDKSVYGTGDPGYTIEDEFVYGLSNLEGTLSMANRGSNTGGSQFFINLVDNEGLDYDKLPLTSKHPVFGKVVDGLDIVQAIGAVEADENGVPVEPVIIESASVI